MVASACAAGALVFLLFAALTKRHGVGRDLHKLFCLVGAYVALRPPLLMAGVFAEERRNQTLGLLFLSGLSAGEIFVSKVFSAAMIAFTGVLAMFPLLALPFLLGGVSFDLFLATVVALPNLLAFALAVTLLASVLTEDDGAAMVLVVVLAVIVSAAPALIYLVQMHLSPGTTSAAWWLRLSPAYGAYLIWTGLGWAPVAEFWRNSAVTLCWSVLCLLAADVALRRLWRQWQENPEGACRSGRWHRMLHGNGQGRRRLAARWLEVNPYVWLAARDREPTALAWLAVGGLALVWLLCLVVWGKTWISVPNFFITAALLNLSLHWMIRYTAAHGLATYRRDGSYELLLTTPLNPCDIVGGQLEALRWHFAPVARVVLIINAALMVAGLAVRSWTPRALFVYGVVWAYLLTWALAQSLNWRGALGAMSSSLNSGRPAHAVWRSAGFDSQSWIWILIDLGWLYAWLSHVGFPRFPSGSKPEILIATAAAGLFLLVVLVKIILATWSRLPDLNTGGAPDRRERLLVSVFREVVRQPMPGPEAPPLKQWGFPVSSYTNNFGAGPRQVLRLRSK